MTHMIAVEPRSGDERPTDTVAFAPVDLDEAPAVDALLRRLGLGPFDRDGLAAPTGRNDVWAGPTASGEKVVVKRLSGEPDDIAARLGRSLAFERFVEGLPADRLSVPAFLGADPESGLIAHRMLPDVRTGAELMVDEIFDEPTARIAGSLVGTLHGSVAHNSSELWTTPPHWPSAHMLVGISDRLFDQLSFAELEGWRLLQSDGELRAAVADLVAGEPDRPRVPAHCDLRVDQFLLAPDALHLSDWEEFRLADPARDVGAFAGEWLYRSVLDIVTTRGGLPAIETEITHEEVLDRGVRNLQRLRGRVQAFWAGYLDARPDPDPALAERSTAFAGWHLLDRLLAGAARASRLSGIERAAAGIGRAALLTPARFTTTIGLGGQP